MRISQPFGRVAASRSCIFRPGSQRIRPGFCHSMAGHGGEVEQHAAFAAAPPGRNCRSRRRAGSAACALGAGGGDPDHVGFVARRRDDVGRLAVELLVEDRRVPEIVARALAARAWPSVITGTSPESASKPSMSGLKAGDGASLGRRHEHATSSKCRAGEQEAYPGRPARARSGQIARSPGASGGLFEPNFVSRRSSAPRIGTSDGISPWTSASTWRRLLAFCLVLVHQCLRYRQMEVDVDAGLGCPSARSLHRCGTTDGHVLRAVSGAGEPLA